MCGNDSRFGFAPGSDRAIILVIGELSSARPCQTNHYQCTGGLIISYFMAFV